MSNLEEVIRYYFDLDYQEEMMRFSQEEPNRNPLIYLFVELSKHNPQNLSLDLSRKRNKILKDLEGEYLFLVIYGQLSALNKKLLLELDPEGLIEDYISTAIEQGHICSIEDAFTIITSIPSKYRIILLSELDNVNAILKAVTDKNRDNFINYFSQPGENYRNVLLFCGMINKVISITFHERDYELDENGVPKMPNIFEGGPCFDYCKSGGSLIIDGDGNFISSADVKEDIKETFKSMLRVGIEISPKDSNRIFDIINNSLLSDTLYFILCEAIYELEGKTGIEKRISRLSPYNKPFSCQLEKFLNNIPTDSQEEQEKKTPNIEDLYSSQRCNVAATYAVKHNHIEQSQKEGFRLILSGEYKNEYIIVFKDGLNSDGTIAKKGGKKVLMILLQYVLTPETLQKDAHWICEERFNALATSLGANCERLRDTGYKAKRNGYSDITQELINIEKDLFTDKSSPLEKLLQTKK